MGEVFFVEDQNLKRRFALKILTPETTPETENALVEFQLLSRLDHPNLVKVYECGVARSGPRRLHKRLFFTMDALEGHHLGDWPQPEDLSERSEMLQSLTREAIQGLCSIHRLGIIHGDLKCENIYLTKEGTVKLLDFGLAASTLSQNLKDLPGAGESRSLSGSVGYWAPELIRGGSRDVRSDLYALGVTLYRLASGRFPDTQHPIPLADQCPWLPQTWTSTVEALLSPEPNDRPGDALAAAKLFGYDAESFESSGHHIQGPLIGRRSEHQKIVDHISEQASSTTWITGQAGLGKTRLCDEVATSLRLRGYAVCPLERPGQEAYAAVKPLFRMLAQTMSDDEVPEFLKTLLSPEQSAKASAKSPRFEGPAQAHAKLAFFDQLSGFVLDRCKHRSLVIIVDHCSEIDFASREWLAYVLRAGRMSKSGLHAIFAGTEKEEALAVEALHVGLEPLSREESAELALALTGDPKRAKRLAEQSAGFPDALVVLASNSSSDVESRHRLPLDDLDETARSCLLSAVLLSRPLTLAELSASQPGAEQALVEAVGQLLEKGLLRRHGGAGGASYTLRLPVLGDAVLEQFDADFVKTQRRRLFDKLSTSNAGVNELARLALEVRPKNLVSLCRQAAERSLELHAFDEAEQVLTACMERVEKPEDQDPLLSDLLDVYQHSGELEKAERTAEALLAMDQEPFERGIVLKKLADVLRSKGEQSRSAKLVEEGLDLLKALRDKADARALMAQFHLLGSRLKASAGDFKHAARFCQDARKSLRKDERDGPLGLRIDIEQSNNEVLTLDRQFYKAIGKRLQHALKTFEDLEDRDGIAMALKGLGLFSFYNEERLAAERYYLKAMDYTGPTGPNALGLLNNLAMIAQQRGDPSTAEWRLQECLTAAERMGIRSVVCRAYTNLGRLRRNQGDIRGSIQALQRAAEQASKAEEPIIESAALSELGDLYLKENCVKKALFAFRQARQRRLEMGDPARVAASELELALLWQESGDIEAAIEHYRLALALYAARDEDDDAAFVVERLIACGHRPGGTAALLTSARVDQNLAVPSEIAEACASGLWCADVSVSLAAVLALREAGDLPLAKTVFSAALRRQPSEFRSRNLAQSLESLGAILSEESTPRQLVAALEPFHSLPDPLGDRLKVVKASILLADRDLSGASQELAKVSGEGSPDIELETKFWLTRIRALAPQLEGLRRGDDATCRTAYWDCVNKARDKRNDVILAMAASDLSGLEAARGQGRAAHSALTMAREAAKRATLRLPQVLKEHWQSRLVQPSTDVVAMNTGQDRLIPMIERVLASDLSLDPLLDLVIGLLVEGTGAERGFLILKEKTGGMAFRSSRNITSDEVLSARGFRGSYSLVESVASSGQTILIADARVDQRLANNESMQDHNTRSVLAAPITLAEEVLAVVYLEHSQVANCFDDDALDLTAAFTAKVATTIRHSRDQAEAIQKAEKRAANYLREIQRLGSKRPLLLGESQGIREARDLIDRFSGVMAPVLIIGESGTGKEIVARALHALGPRHEQPFQAINCAAFSEELLDAELFGYRKGAFTGAVEDRPGVIESADGGTLFLDEVGDMPPSMQVKLLRVLANSEFRRIGEHRARKVSVRILAATHRHLESMIVEGSFREDLYYRLNVLKIQLPPLRSRREDIPALVSHFLEEADAKRELRLSPAVLKSLYEQEYPGNVRELKNMILRASTLCSGSVIRMEHLMLDPVQNASALESPLIPSTVPLNARQKAILTELEQRGGFMTTKDHCARHDVSERTGLRDLKELVEHELLQKIGSRKSARYQLPSH